MFSVLLNNFLLVRNIFKRSLIILLQIIFFISRLSAQLEKDTINAYQIQNKINFDGKLDDEVWESGGVSNFTQRELNYGQPSTEKTRVAILYDNTALYFGIWCY